MICAKSGQNWPSGSGEIENVKVYRQTDGQTDDGQRTIKKAHLRWVKKNKGKKLWNMHDPCINLQVLGIEVDISRSLTLYGILAHSSTAS
jgi:hypothetical protein